MLRTELIRPLPETLAEHAERRGGAPAFADAHRRVTYAELEARTRRVAGHLAGLRVQPGDRVAILLGNRVENVESYLAITRASAIGVPLNPHSTDAELAYFLEDSGARVVITDTAHADQVARVRGTDRYPLAVVAGAANPPAGTVSFDAMATTEPADDARDDLDLDDVAWMLYTSGTTGRPKGVLSTQRNCLWSVAACYVPVPELTGDDRVLWPLPLFHSLSHIACVLAVTAVGASARITDGYSADEVLAAMRAESPTFVAGVPTMYHYLVQAARQHGFEAPDLRVGLVGGSVTTAALRRSVEETFGVPLLDAYGCTETCGSIAINWPSGARVEGSCGLPVPGLNVRLVDPESGRDVPAGAEGEVWVSGPSVMVGYHNRPDETAAVLRGGWYRTGDLARRDDAGYLTISGRIKDLVIRGGENVHPGEVEEVIRGVPGVADVAVVGKPHDVLGEVVVAYLVPGTGGLDTDAVFAACRERLAPFKVPEELYEIAGVPRTRSGKVTRHVLLDVHARLRAAGIGYYENLLRLDWVPVPSTGAEVGADVTVLHVPPSDDVREALEAVRSRLADQPVGRLVVVTRNGARVRQDDRPDPAHAAVTGFVRGFQARHTGRVVLVDLADESDVDEQVLAAVLAAVLADGGPRFAVRSGSVVAPVLARLPAGETVRPERARTAVIAGADTSAAANIARHLVAVHGVRRLLLLTERGPDDPVVAELADELPALSPGRRATVLVAGCDLDDREALTRALGRLGEPPSTVVCAAGADGVTSVAAVTAVAELAGDAMLVLVSDAAATLEVDGDPDAAAVAGLCDALAVRRHAASLPAVSLSVGPWTGGETADELPVGVGTLSRRELLAAVDAALLAGEPSVVSVRLDAAPRAGGAVPALLREVIDTSRGGGAAPSDDRAAVLRAELAALPAADRVWTLVDRVCAAAADVRADAGADPDRAFRDAGFSSLQAVQLRDRLVELTGLPLPATLVFDHPTPRATGEHLVAELMGTESGTDAPAAHGTHDGEPVAIVGMACRLPGGIGSPEELWTFLAGDGDAIRPFPTDRGWDLDSLYDPDPEHAGTTYVRDGGFLADAAGFDAEFFGISPREALSMDPQQRLFLEVVWEAFERAGIDVTSLQGSRTGVFAGVMNQEYGSALAGAADNTEGYRATGASGSVVSGRVAYSFGFEGPAVTVDTACSSSLVALHLAAASLRSGESDLALAGGVAVMASPASFVEFSRQRGLAGDGRCKAFAAAADGTGWSEGVAVLVLERLSDARRNGHGVLAVVAGSAVNSDGASNGLTAPNGLSQQQVIRQALANAGIASSDVDVVEAHGTGTTLGDPIEAQALIATYGQGRDRPLWLGSLKSNIGHTQAAAGVAGVIKSVLVMRHGVLPRTLHVDVPSSHVDWSAGAVELLTEAVAWPEVDRPRRAGVSAFGVSGTNAHVILEQAPPEPMSEVDPETEAAVVPWVLSARSATALADSARRLAEYVAGHDGLTDIRLAGLLAGRARLSHRAVVVGADREELLRGLGAVAAGAPDPSVVSGVVGTPGKTVFVFPGQGTQWVGMGAGLLGSPVFAAAVVECDEALSSFVDWSVLDVIRQVDGTPSLERVDVVQPVSFVMMVALARLWRHHGVAPDAVIGHSQGEIAAAHVAGALSLADAARVVALRSQAIARHLAGRGAMMSVALSLPEAEERIVSLPGLAIATVNGPGSVVVAGEPEAVERLRASLDADGVRARRIAVDYASHTSHVERLEDELAELLAPVVPRAPEIPMWSTVDNAWIDGPVQTGAYWYRNLRHTVRFQHGIDALAGTRHTLFVEVSAHPVLTAAIEDTLAERTAALVVPTLRRDRHEPTEFHTALAQVHVNTALPVDWHLSAARPDLDHPLPAYPFQHQRYWPRPAEPATTADPVEARFWAAVDQQDPAALADTLDAGLDTRDAFASVLPVLAGWRARARRGAAVDPWRYRVVWRRLGVVNAERMTGTWLAVVPGNAGPPVTAALDVLRARGAEVVEVTTDDVRAGRLPADVEPRAVLSFLALDETPHHEFPVVPAGLVGLAALLPALAGRGITAPVWAVTAGATGTGERPVQALTWGLGLVAALEHPRTWGGLIDLPAEPDDRALRHLPGVLLGQGDEDQLALRADDVLARRLVRVPLGGTERRAWTPRGTVLVTGGTGGVGAHVARWLAANGVDHLLLLSRRGRDAEGTDALVAELTSAGAEVTVAACDVTSRAEVAAAVAAIPGDRPLTAVVHAAGVGQRETPIAETGPAELTRVLAGKVAGARNLDDVLGDHPLDAFVLISSNAGVWGGGGQAAYAAANAYLDALAAHRRGLGRTATSVAWGSWAGAGLGAVDGAAERLARLGLPAMDPELAVAALVAAVEADETTVSVADVDWSRFAPGFTAARPSPLLRELPDVQAVLREQDTGSTGADWAARLAELAPAEHERAVLVTVQANAAAVLGHANSGAVVPDTAFTELGFDSMTAVQLRNGLVREFGLRLPTTLLFDHPTARALATHLVAELSGGAGKTQAVTTAAAADEPIAIVGMACRLPGGIGSPEDLWTLLVAGDEALSDFPADRGWDIDAIYDPEPGLPGRTYTRRGGFLDTATEFDPAFFGISPREALGMDPQHRVFLEAAWEAFERSGIDVTSLRGSRTGVFAGGFHTGYTIGADLIGAGVDGYTSHNNLPSVLSGRVAYHFGLEGPAVTVDTACSSSLVALHLASGSLRSGESDLALAGGVAVMARPSTFVEFSRQRGLAADGRCKAFAAAADGTGWSEGVAVLVLERLSDARRNGHGVLALVRGSAVNSDGTSNGLTAPNGSSQQRVIRQALANAGLEPSDVDSVEAHGTGTTLGDPIEAQALIAAYGQDRDRPLWLGSLKSNIGHTQAAAGVAGVIKMVLAMRHGVLPMTLHVDAPTPHVDWSAGSVELLTEATAWPRVDRPRRAGISAFGVSGTNAHVIIEQVGEPEPAPVEDGQATVSWVLSARTPGALAAFAARLVDHAERNPGHTPTAIADRLAVRARHEHRAAVTGSDREELLRGLGAVAAGAPDPSVVSGVAEVEGRTVFVFPGQGTQWVGMGAGLLGSSVFAGAVVECDEALSSFVDWSVLDVIRRVDGAPSLERVDVVQPVSFVMMVALARLWRHHGVAPDAVVGHSQGEIAAAHVAGALSLDDAARVVALRSRTIARHLAGRGAMLSVALPVETVEELLPSFAGLAVATVNGPGSVVVAGEPEAVERLRVRLDGEGVRARRIAVDYASHTSQVERLEEELAELLAPVVPRAPEIPMWSTVDNAWIDGPVQTGAYWYRNLRHTVRFHAAVEALAEQDHRVFVEISTHPVLTAPIEETLQGSGGLVVPTLRRDRHEPTEFHTALAQVHVSTGVPVDWHLSAARPDLDHPLPAYAFQHQRYWLETGATGDLGTVGLGETGHPLLGVAVHLPDSGGVVFTNRVSLRTQPWLAEHAVSGTVVLPGAALLELAVRAGDEVGAGTVAELVIEAPLTVPEQGGPQLRVSVGELDGDRRPVTVHSRVDGDGEPWTRHASGLLTGTAATPAPLPWPPAGAERVAVDDFYPGQRAAGLELGPLFLGLRAVWTTGDEVFAEVALPEGAEGTDAFLIHPALLDAALHAAAYLPGRGGAQAAPRLPFAWSGVTLHAGGATALRVRVRSTGADDVSVELTDTTGGPVASIAALTTRAVDIDALFSRTDHLYRVDWVPVTVREAGTVPDVVLDLTAGTGGPAPERARVLVLRALETIQRHLAEEDSGRRLVVLTRDARRDPAMAAVWGLGRTAQSEHPGRVVLVDTDTDTDTDTGAGLLPAALATGEPQLAVRGGTVTAPRLVRHQPSEPVRPLDPDRTVLITGGTGTLGGLVARRLVTHHGVRHLLLTSRRGRLAPGADRLAEELTSLGATVTVESCDLGDRAAVATLLDRVPAGHPLTAVVHSAAALDDGVLTALDAERVERVFAPKVDGAWHLHELTRQLDLAAFVVFSSASGTLGNAGQGNYAAANAFLDGLAEHRRVLGLPATSLAWGLWASASELTGELLDGTRGHLKQDVAAMTDDEGVRLLDAAFARPADPAVLVPIKLDLASLRRSANPPAVVHGLLPARPVRRTAEQAVAGASFVDELRGLAREEQRARLVDLVRANAAATLGHTDHVAIAERQSFRDLGFDSLAAVDLRNRVSAATGLRLPATLVFDHPDPVALAEHLHDELGLTGRAEPSVALAEVDRLAAALEDLLGGNGGNGNGEVAERLYELAGRWRGAAPDTDLDAVSDDEIFRLAEAELGRS